MGRKVLFKHSGEYLVEVVMSYYDNRSTVMTNNRPIQDRFKLLSYVTAGSAILDRIYRYAQTILYAGRSYQIQVQTPAKEEEERNETTGNPH